MAVIIKVPNVGESITEVTVSSWRKSNGASVVMDDIICELESDKASFEVGAEVTGKLTIQAKEGATLKIGDTLGSIEPENILNSTQTDSTPPQTEPKPVSETIEVKMPTVGESITEVVISSWKKSDGDHVELDEMIAEIESDKATFDLTATATGKLTIMAKEGDTIEIGALVCSIAVSTEDTSSKPSSTIPTNDAAQTPVSHTSYAVGHASPAASKIIREKSLVENDIKGTGRAGRITKSDALLAKEKDVSSKNKVESTEDTDTKLKLNGRATRTERMSTLRKTIARRLVQVKNQTAMLTTFNEVNMAPIMEIRSKYKEAFKEKYETGLGFMSFFTKACCHALQEWNAINARLDESQIIYHQYCDISIAVSTPKGLVVPVIRNAESLSFDQIEKNIVRLAVKAREGKLSIEEMEGGTFTITNGGIFGSMLSTPIINTPQSAILGMHNIVERPVIENKQIVIRPMMYLALSYDHRIVDGRESVSFLVRVKQLLEDPSRLLLGI